jgi:hypothetical protein
MSETISDAWVKRGTYLIIILLVLALFKMPFAYYQIMKVAVTAYFIIYASVINKCHVDWINITCWILAAVYNPFLQLHIGRGPWTVVNVLSIVFCIQLLIQLRQKNNLKFLNKNEN